MPAASTTRAKEKPKLAPPWLDHFPSSLKWRKNERKLAFGLLQLGYYQLAFLFAVECLQSKSIYIILSKYLSFRMKTTNNFVNQIDCFPLDPLILSSQFRCIIVCLYIFPNWPELIDEEVVLHLEVVLNYPRHEGGGTGKQRNPIPQVETCRQDNREYRNEYLVIKAKCKNAIANEEAWILVTLWMTGAKNWDASKKTCCSQKSEMK